jgi:aldehyde:ferredoxin oxidoreductase
VIGIAGEKKVMFANIRTGMKSSAGKGGGGAVMGSKKLKAISVRGSIDIEFHNPEGLYNYCQELNDKFMRTKWGKSLSKWGSTSMYSHVSTSGYLRNKNLKSNKMENAEAIDIEHIHEYQTGKSSCFGCGVCCRHRYYYSAKPYGPFKAEGPEFTTQLYLGHLLNCADFDHILVANHLTNKLL